VIYKRVLDSLKSYPISAINTAIKVDANEAGYNMPPLVAERVLNRLSNIAFNRYPHHAVESLQHQLATHFKTAVLLGNGSSELIEKTFFAFSEDRSNIVFPRPSFSMYRTYAHLADATPVEVPLNADGELDIDLFIKTVKDKNASLAVVCNPNNPTGNIISVSDISRIAASIECPLLVDEAYMDFADMSAIGLIGTHRNLLIAKTFSKAFGLAAARIGYLLTNDDLAALLAKAFMPYHINELSATVADIVFQMRHEYYPLISQTVEQRKFMARALRAFQQLKVFPSSANFLFFSAPSHLDNALLAQSIALRSFVDIPHHYRLTISTPSDNEQILSALGGILQ
jgi:histidinol-phosphate aminotransferase